MTSQGPQILTNLLQNVCLVFIQLVSKDKVDWSIFGETVAFLIFSQFVWNFLPSSDETPRTPILGMLTAQNFYETCKTKF